MVSVIMDFLLAGSEVFHRVKLHNARNNPESQEMVEQGQMLNNGLHPPNQQQHPGQPSGGQHYQYQQQPQGGAHQL